jgi:hypothetical protein
VQPHRQFLPSLSVPQVQLVQVQVLAGQVGSDVVFIRLFYEFFGWMITMRCFNKTAW